MANTTGKKFGGRKVGTPNKKTEQWKTFSSWFLSKGLERLEIEMNKLEGKDFVYTVKDLLEYFKPKLARVENKHEGEVTVVTGFKLKSNKK